MNTLILTSIVVGVYAYCIGNLVSICNNKRLMFSSHIFREDTLQAFSTICVLALIFCIIIMIAKLSLIALITVGLLTYVLIYLFRHCEKMEKT